MAIRMVPFFPEPIEAVLVRRKEDDDVEAIFLFAHGAVPCAIRGLRWRIPDR